MIPQVSIPTRTRTKNRRQGKGNNKGGGKSNAKVWLKQEMGEAQISYNQDRASQVQSNMWSEESLYEVRIQREEQVQTSYYDNPTNPNPPEVQFIDLSDMEKENGCGGWPGAATDHQ